VIVGDPTPSADVVNVAFAEPSNATVANVIAPSLNTMLPVGVPVPGACADTDAVNVTGWPNTDGDPDDEMTVAVPIWLATSETAFDVLPVKVASPP
jgi:hypothetical protein